MDATYGLLARSTRLDDFDQDPAVLQAAMLAARLRASLGAVHVVPAGIAPLSPDNDGGALFAAYAEELAQRIEEARNRAGAFAAWASSMGAAHPQWFATGGNVAGALAYVANWHDLMVLARSRKGSGTQPKDTDPWSGPAGLGDIVLSSPIPCLVTPPDAPALPAVGTVAVAWNGSVEAIRALHAALPLLEGARVVILKGRRKPLLEPLPEFPLESWCERRLHHVDYMPLDPDADGPAIHAAARDAGAGLLVMGAYGRSRFAERMLGGVTRYMLEHAELPLLLMH